MYKLKLLPSREQFTLKASIKFPDVIKAKLQDKTVTPSKSVQEVIADNEYDGLNKVTVEKIPDKYIIPDGIKTIDVNGVYDIKEYSQVNVNIPEKKLGTKTITVNGTYKSIDDDLDGYSEVTVETSGVDINNYFSSDVDGSKTWYYSVKQLPQLNVTGTSLNGFFSRVPMKKLIQPIRDTSNITDMRYFVSSETLEELNLSNFDTSKVINMSSMFRECIKLITLDLSNFNTSNVTDMSYVFNGCSSLTSLNLSNFNTSKVTNMSNMFAYCSKLTSLDLSNSDTSKVTNMYNMFNGCKSLTHLDMRNFDFTKVTSYSNMFGAATTGVPNDCEIIVKDDTAKEWITTHFTNLTNVKTVAEL